MIVVRNNDYIVAYRNNKLYEQDNPKISSLEDIYTPLTSKDVYSFCVSGTTYKQKQQSAYYQCKLLLGLLKCCRYSNSTLFEIVGWVQRNLGRFGIAKRIREEGLL